MGKDNIITLGMRKIPGNYAEVAGSISSAHQGLSEKFTTDAERLEKAEQIKKDLNGRTPFFDDPVKPLDITALTQRLSAENDYPYVQGDFDGGGLSDVMMKIILVHKENGMILGETEEYIGSIRLCYVNDDNRPSCLGICWIKDTPSMMVINLTTDLDKPPQERPCSFFVSQDTLKTMKEIDMYKEVCAKIEPLPIIPDEQLGPQLEAQIASDAISSATLKLLKGKEVLIRDVRAVLSEGTYSQSETTHSQSHKMDFGDSAVIITPQDNKLSPISSARQVMMKMLLQTIRPTDRPDIKVWADEDVLNAIKSQSFALFVDLIATELGRAANTPKDITTDKGITASAYGAYKLLKERLIQSKEANIPTVIRDLHNITTQLHSKKLSLEDAKNQVRSQLLSLGNHNQVGDLAKEYLEDINALTEAEALLGPMNEANFGVSPTNRQ